MAYRTLTDNTSCTITNLVILALRQLHQKPRNLVLNLHLTQDSRSIVRDSDLTVGRDEDFVKT